MVVERKQQADFDPGYLANKSHQFKKAWGQNFLRYQADAARLIANLALTTDTLVVEIGAGGGALTAALLQRQFRVLAFEIDLSLQDFLCQRFQKELLTGQLDLLWQDALEIDWRAKFAAVPKIAVVSNLPYAQTRELILKIYAEIGEKLLLLALMLQTEASQRLVAAHPQQANYQAKLYGPQAVFTQLLFAKPDCQKIAATAFYPVPKVSNSFIILRRDADKFTNYLARLAANSLDQAEFTPYFARFLASAFQHRRKHLLNSFVNPPRQEHLLAALEELALANNIRAEELAPEQLLQLAIAMYNRENKKSD